MEPKTVTIAELKDMVFGPGEVIVEDTHVSGVCKKGNEVICTLPLIEYRLTVDVSGVAVSELAAKITTANLTVRSQQLLKQWAITDGSTGTLKRLGNPTKTEPSEKEPVAKWKGGTLRLTWAEMFPAERAKLTPEQQIAQQFAKMGKEDARAMLEKMLAAMA